MPHFFDSAFVEMLDEKSALREFLEGHGLNNVPFRRVSQSSETAGWERFPCMVKPVDAQGQRGVFRVDRATDLADAVSRARALSRRHQAIVESYLSGVEVSCNVLVCGGEARIKVLSERLVHGPEALGVPKGHLIPAPSVSDVDQARALDLVDSVVAAMRQEAGVLYFQMIITSAGPRVIEIAPRLDGCHIWRLIKAAYGIDFLEKTIDCLTGRKVAPMTFPGAVDTVPMELMFLQSSPGERFDHKRFPVPDIAEYHEYRYMDGDLVRPVNGTLEVVGYYVGPRK